MSLDINNTEPVVASVEALRRFFLRQFNAVLSPVWRDGEGQDSLDYIAFDGALSRYGLTGLRSNRVLNEEERTEITSTFQTIVGGIASMRERTAELRRLDAHQTLHLNEEISNVVPMLKPYSTSERKSPTTRGDNRWILKLDCLIESPSHSEIFKMARELHEHSQRHAFIEFKELDEKSRTYPDEFTQLGAISVFIPDIFMLTRHEQFCLTQILRHDAAHRPLVFVGSHLPFAKLKADSDIQPEFLTLISRAYLKLTKTVAQYKSEGLFHYFLDSLT